MRVMQALSIVQKDVQELDSVKKNWICTILAGNKK